MKEKKLRKFYEASECENSFRIKISPEYFRDFQDFFEIFELDYCIFQVDYLVWFRWLLQYDSEIS